MQPLELTFVSSIKGRPSRNKGSVVPSWHGNVNNRQSWYSESGVSYFYNMLIDNTSTIYIQYGQNNENWASGRFFVQQLQIINQTFNNDNSITTKVRSRMLSFHQRKRDGLEELGYHIIYDFRVFGNKVVSYEGNAGDTITEGASNWYEKTFRVPAGTTEEGTGIEWSITYPNQEVSNSNLFIGFGLKNPNPPTYIPMASRKGGTWKDLNTNKGKILVRKNGTWQNKSEENVNTSKEENKGKNRIRKNGKWLQLPPMKEGRV